MSGQRTARIPILQRFRFSIEGIMSRFSKSPKPIAQNPVFQSHQISSDSTAALHQHDQLMRNMVVEELPTSDWRQGSNNTIVIHPNLFQAVTRIFDPGERIDGRFLVKRKIAGGGEGTLYECRDLFYQNVDVNVAVKVLNDPDLVDGIEAEVSDLQKLRGEPALGNGGVAGLRGYSQDYAYVVMRLVEGKTLSSYMVNEFIQRGIYDYFDGIREADDATDYALAALRIIREVLRVLEWAHAKGVVHADISMKNVLVNIEGEEYEVTVVDWGLGKFYNDSPANIIAGKPQYMAPEQARGEIIDGRADVYSTGLTLYKILTGEIPFNHLPREGRDDTACDRRALGDAFGLPLYTVSKEGIISIFGQDTTWHDLVVDPDAEELELLYFNEAAIYEIADEDKRNKILLLAASCRTEQLNGIFDHLKLASGLEHKIRQLLDRMTAVWVGKRYTAAEAGAAIDGILAAYNTVVN